MTSYDDYWKPASRACALCGQVHDPRVKPGAGVILDWNDWYFPDGAYYSDHANVLARPDGGGNVWVCDDPCLDAMDSLYVLQRMAKGGALSVLDEVYVPDPKEG